MSSHATTPKWLGLIAWLLVSFAASAVGALASLEAKSFYHQLVQPVWAPPAGVFGPVWTTLFALMGIAAWLVWCRGGWRANQRPLGWFLLQLVINGLWSWLFFAWQLGAWALANVVLLWVVILVTLLSFWRVRPLAAVLLLPYLLWVSFAVVLNLSLWQLNPQLLG